MVNNAGITEHAAILDEDVREKWLRVIETDLTGTFLMTEAVAKAMVENGWSGSVINTTSVHSQVPVVNGAYYPAAKAGLAAATKSWALELAEHGIRVNAIAPGAIMNTGMNRAITPEDDSPKARELRIPLGRHGQPEEIADAIVFLATNDYITGHELVVDGGFSLTH